MFTIGGAAIQFSSNLNYHLLKTDNCWLSTIEIPLGDSAKVVNNQLPVGQTSTGPKVHICSMLTGTELLLSIRRTTKLAQNFKIARLYEDLLFIGVLVSVVPTTFPSVYFFKLLSSRLIRFVILRLILGSTGHY